MHHPRIEEIERHWAARFMCSYDEFVQPGPLLQLRADERNEILLFRHGQSSLVTIPPSRWCRILSQFDERSLEIPQTASALHEILQAEPIRDIESGYRFYLDPSRFESQSADNVRRLVSEDENLLGELRAPCSADDWNMAEVRIDQPVVLGCFVGEVLAAAASFIYLGERGQIADLHVITHPGFRRLGLGRAVCSALIQLGINENRIVQWEADERNVGSIALARSLGFDRYVFMQRFILK